jgi:transposase
VENTKLAKSSSLSSIQLQAFEEHYDALLQQSYLANPLLESGENQPKNRGRPKRSQPLNLLHRFREHKSAVLASMYDFTVPFDNNQAERDIRMMKVKQKVSWFFCATQGAEIFCQFPGYFSTARTNGQ